MDDGQDDGLDEKAIGRGTRARATCAVSIDERNTSQYNK